MNVLYITHTCDLTGSQKSLIDLFKIRNDKITPIVIVPKNGSFINYLEEQNIEHHVVSYTSFCKEGIISEQDQLANNYCAALRIADILKDRNIEIVHTNSSVCDVGAIAALLLRVPHVWHIREFVEEDFNGRYFNIAIKKKLFKLTDCIITISKSVQELFEMKYGIRTNQIYNGIYFKDYRISHCIKNNFIFAGTITPHKGQIYAVDAVKYLVDEGIRSFKLYIIGFINDDDIWFYKKYISNLGIEEYVELISFQKNIMNYYDIGRYSICGSKMEALGRSTIEAMFSGLIPIGTESGGTKEVIGDDNTRGFLYKYGDSFQLAEKMKAVMNLSETEYENTKKKAMDFVSSTFNIEKYYRNILDVYRNVKNNYIFTKEKACLINEIRTRCQKMVTDNNLLFDKREIMWSLYKSQNNTLSRYFKDKEINKIGIYGMGVYGRMLYDDLVDHGSKIDYVIDKRKHMLEKIINVYGIDDEIPMVDMIIVTIKMKEEEYKDFIINQKHIKAVGLCELIESVLDYSPK